MSNLVQKYRLKYLKSTNGLLLVSAFVIIRTIFFLFGNEHMIYLLEINRMTNLLGVFVSSYAKFLGPIVDVSMSLVISVMIFLLWKESQKGRIKFFIAFVAFYFLDMFLYFYSYDVISFLIHFVFLSYMVFGIIYYKKMYVEYLFSKNNKKEEEQ
ncbi:MAG: hypothetical protein E7184_03315 [Erysipelotrichaceae bacterium]|nr:hypothetical protein [Erysipelotrichaceae bacterium]